MDEWEVKSSAEAQANWGNWVPQKCDVTGDIEPNHTEFTECDHLVKFKEAHAVSLGWAFRFPDEEIAKYYQVAPRRINLFCFSGGINNIHEEHGGGGSGHFEIENFKTWRAFSLILCCLVNMGYLKNERQSGRWTAGNADGVDELNMDFCAGAYISGMLGSSWLRAEFCLTGT